jgi:hypothetical protein
MMTEHDGEQDAAPTMLSADDVRRRLVTCANCHKPKPHRAHGLCTPCYHRWNRHGRPDDGVPEPWAKEPEEIDHAAVFRAITNDQIPPLNWAELKQAARALRRAGMSFRAIGAQLGCHNTTALRANRSDR